MTVGALRAVVESLGHAEPDVDPQQWAEKHLSRHDFQFPPTEQGRAKCLWWLVERMADGDIQPRNVAFTISHASNLNDGTRILVERLIEPLIGYLEERVGTQSEMLYLLERYKRRVEWFDREQMYAAYEADTRHGEALYDQNLRRYLLDQGVDYPFSQPSSASGEVDVIAGTETDDPLVCEVKLFNGDSYGKAYVAKGLHQAVQYAQDYNKAVAYLVVFNLSERALVFPSDAEPEQWPPRLQVGGVTVYLVGIRARPSPTASKSGKARPTSLTREDLVEPD